MANAGTAFSFARYNSSRCGQAGDRPYKRMDHRKKEVEQERTATKEDQRRRRRIGLDGVVDRGPKRNIARKLERIVLQAARKCEDVEEEAGEWQATEAARMVVAVQSQTVRPRSSNSNMRIPPVKFASVDVHTELTAVDFSPLPSSALW